jgi:hypothetical protein
LAATVRRTDWAGDSKPGHFRAAMHCLPPSVLAQIVVSLLVRAEGEKGNIGLAIGKLLTSG